MAEMGRPISECLRHGLPSAPTGNSAQPYYVARCVHRDTRFVVEIRPANTDFHSEWSAVDYVEDVEDERSGHLCTIESHDCFGAAQAEAEWQRCVARLRQGDPPCPGDE